MCQHKMQPYTQQKNLITALPKPQPTNYKLAALQQLATIFQSSITNKPVSVLGVPDIAHKPPPPTQPPQPPTHNPPPPTPTPAPMSTKSDQETCECSPHSSTWDHTLPHQIQTNRGTKTRGGYGPRKRKGLLEDPFTLIRAANSVMDPNTGQQLKYK